MAIAKIGCEKQIEDDGSVTLIITVSGLQTDEADVIGPMLEEPCKAAVVLGTAGRHTPDTHMYNPHTGENTPLKPETRQ